MQSKHAIPVPRRDTVRRLFAVSLLALQLAPPAHAGVSNTGRWTPSPHWVWGHDVPYNNGTIWLPRTPVHMTLIPGGTSGFHSRILFFDGDGFTLPMAGGMWGWNPGENGACLDTARLGFTEIPLFDPPHNIFCSSHTLLPPRSFPGDTSAPRVFIAGGTEQGEVGLTKTAIFDPAGTTQATMWTPGPDLSARRWYPTTTITPLQPPTLWTYSGVKFALWSTYGGRDPAAAPNASPSSVLRRLGLNVEGTWESDKTAKSPLAPSGAQYVWPRALMHHAFTTTDLWSSEATKWARQPGVPVMFGGEYPVTGGLSINNKTYLMYEKSLHTGTDEDYYFEDLSVASEPPPGLARAEAVMFSDGVTVVDTAGNPHVGVVAWGGRTASGPADRTKMWHMQWDTLSSPHGYKWFERTITDSASSAPPSNRYGHAAFYDPLRKRILIWGGTSNGTDPVSDAAVYALDIANPTAPKWKPVTVTGVPPSQRFGHRMIFDNIGRRRVIDSSLHYRGLLFGGKTAGGALSNEAYSLWITASNGDLEWKQILYTGAQTPPDARAYHVMMRDEYTDRLLVFGGQRASGTGDLRAWALELPASGSSYQNADNPGSNPSQWSPAWNQLDSDATLGVQGGAAFMSKSPTVARTPDLYTFGSGGPTRQTYAASSLYQDLYPFNFILPNGKLFTTGPGYNSFTLDGPGAT